ncbi:hypothetical protein [Rhizobium sp. WYJ-E13]|nr:hypothetical protein [Rhizobium sp. WYJ-E13]QWW72290.1 hypothetical protein KQ933_32455 [Rhizobium sp. WYJ-E13]
MPHAPGEAIGLLAVAIWSILTLLYARQWWAILKTMRAELDDADQRCSRV